MNLCACGCGGETAISNQTRPRQGHVKGEPYKYLRGHHMRGKIGAEHPGWRGGRNRDSRGYVLVRAPEHPAAFRNGRIREHRLVMEAHLGRPLSRDEDVHHVNGDKADNRVENLEVLSRSDHARLHATAA